MVLDRQKMKNITIALPEIYVNNLERLQDIGMVPSRSEAIRLAVREFLKREVHVSELLEFEKKESPK
jgi:Arc/MetJ-type ribon-helix-helix transcriptional regulator